MTETQRATDTIARPHMPFTMALDPSPGQFNSQKLKKSNDVKTLPIDFEEYPASLRASGKSADTIERNIILLTCNYFLAEARFDIKCIHLRATSKLCQIYKLFETSSYWWADKRYECSCLEWNQSYFAIRSVHSHDFYFHKANFFLPKLWMNFVFWLSLRSRKLAAKPFNGRISHLEFPFIAHVIPACLLHTHTCNMPSQL